MTPYADIHDLTAKYGQLTPAQLEVAPAYLEDASILIRDILQSYGKSVEDFMEDTIRKITTDVAYRGLSAVNVGSAVSQSTVSAIGYSETFTYANPSGDLYLTKLEKKQLGIGGGTRAFTVYPKVGVCEHAPW